MGILDRLENYESNKATKEAREALQAGANTYTPEWRAGTPAAARKWGEMIDAIEAAGWVLVSWQVGTAYDTSGSWPAAYPLFRRKVG